MKTLLIVVKNFLVNRRKALLLAALLLAVAIGGAVGWKWRQYRQGPLFAAERLKNALKSSKFETLAALTDFRTLSSDLARWILAERPHTPRLGKEEASSVSLLAEEVQRSLLSALEQAKTPDESPPTLPPDAPLPPWPNDIIPQLTATLQVLYAEETKVFLRANATYPVVKRTIPIILLMEKQPDDAWMLTRVFNAGEAVRQFVEAEAALQRQREEVVEEKNRDEMRKMNAQLELETCAVNAHVLSDKRTAMLLAEITGINKGEHAIYAMNLIMKITGENFTLRRPVNMARRILPREKFSYVWRQDLDDGQPEDAALLAAPTLQCGVRPQAMTLGNGHVLYLRDMPADPRFPEKN